MSLSFTFTRKKRGVLFYSTLIFVLQSLAPALQGVMAKSTAGYFDTLCTMYGPVTVFVKLDEGEQLDDPECYECSVCILQANLNAQPVAHDLRLEARYLMDQDSLGGPLFGVGDPPQYLNFLTRAPPA